MIYELLFSRTGRAENVLKILSDEFRGEKCRIDLSDPNLDGDKYSITDEDFCILATSVYEGRMPLTAAENLKKVKGNGAKLLLVAVFGNRAQEDCLIEMRDIAAQQGFAPVAGIESSVQHSIMPWVAEGRPDEADIAELKEFAAKVKEKLAKNITDPLNVPGNFPYRARNSFSVAPAANDECIECGLCAAKCPAQAIDPANPRVTDVDKCIACMRCIEICPVKARGIPQGMAQAVYRQMKQVFEERKPNRLYL